MLKKSLFSLLAVILLFTGCSTHQVAQGDITFTDALNRTVTVKKGTLRASALIGSFADVWLLAGGTVVSTSDDAFNELELPLKNAINIGETKSPSFEKVLESDPEIVIASASTPQDVSLLESFTSVGIPIIYFDVSTFDDYLKMLKICTDITGRDDLYAENGIKIQRRIEELKKEYLPKIDKNRTALFLRASTGSIRAKGNDGTVLGEMLNDINVKNIADSDKTVLESLSVEGILQADPYFIFSIPVGSNEEKAKNGVLQMLEEPLWRDLSAVKNGRVHFLDKALFNNKPNAKWDIAYETLFKILCT